MRKGKLPAFIGGCIVASTGVAWLFWPRSQRGSVQVISTHDGPGGYVHVATDSFTFLVPESVAPYFEDCQEASRLAHYVLGSKKIDGVRVGTAG